MGNDYTASERKTISRDLEHLGFRTELQYDTTSLSSSGIDSILQEMNDFYNISY